MLPDGIFMDEGQTSKICVILSENEQSRQRDIHIAFSIRPVNNTGSK